MTDDNNQEDKPSFFDFSEEEARSWPPSGSYETEDEGGIADTPEEDASTKFDVTDLVEDDVIAESSDKPETVKEEAKPEGEGGDYVDMLFTCGPFH